VNIFAGSDVSSPWGIGGFFREPNPGGRYRVKGMVWFPVIPISDTAQTFRILKFAFYGFTIIMILEYSIEYKLYI
jgi:hypothetical protein